MDHTHFDAAGGRLLNGNDPDSALSASSTVSATDGMVGTRKRVYGHDMLYVAVANGSKVGRVNLETGRVTMDRAELRAAFDRFVAHWRATHLEMPLSGGGRDETTDLAQHASPHPANPNWGAPYPTTRVPHSPHTPPGGPAAADTAGASARYEYNRRSQRELAKKRQRVADDAQWREQIKADRPVLGRLTSALTAKPKITPESQSTAAWKVGAEGERRVGEELQGVRGIEVLHDRLVPGSRANIDHLVVGPSGVFVVDAKKYKGKIEVRDKGGMFRHDPHLYVNGRDRTKAIDGVLGQIAVVRTALGDQFADVKIRGVLCFVGAEWPLIKRPHRVNGVTAVWLKGLPKIVTARGPLDDRMAEVAEHLRSQLRPAVR